MKHVYIQSTIHLVLNILVPLLPTHAAWKGTFIEPAHDLARQADSNIQEHVQPVGWERPDTVFLTYCAANNSC
eukprot:4304916-Amphidinium_carterae.2